MSGGQIHRATSRDGTEIAGRVCGQGPPLVLVHGAMDDGEMDWSALLPFLTDRFTCYVMSTRRRGLSDDNPDHSPQRLVEDVAAFAESAGEPVGLVGLSGGGMLSLGAAAQCPSVSAVAVHEPVIFEAMNEDDAARFNNCVSRMQELAEENKPVEAAEVFGEMVANHEEFAAIAEAGGVEAAARYLSVDLTEFQAIANGPSPTALPALEQIAAPVLLLHGSHTALPWFTASVHHAARRIPNAEVRELDGAGHLAPIVEPKRVADEIIPFFSARAEAM